MESVLVTKVLPPRVHGPLVPRQRLTAALDSALTHPVLLVSAPAGSGKTTALVQWASVCELPTAWLSVDASDSDVIAFAAGLKAAIDVAYPGSTKTIDAMLRGAETPSPERIAQVIVRDLASIDRPLVLILDDYHEIGGLEVHKLMAALIERLPGLVHVVIASRIDPPLGVLRLRARDVLVEMRAADLRFTVDEARAYFARRSPVRVSDDVVDLIAKRTDGWVAGLQLASIHLRQPDDVDRLAQSFARGTTRNIVDFLFQEVLSSQPKSIQSLMIQLSVLDQFCEDLCKTLIANEPELAALDVHEALLWLERSNLFITTLDDAGHWYRFHDLFREMLLMRLEISHGRTKAQELHRRASAWYAAQGLVDQALQHALAGEDAAEAAVILEREITGLLNREKWLTLRRWLFALPESAIGTRPKLLLARATLSNVQGGERDQSQAIAAAKEALDRANPPDKEREAVMGHIDSLESSGAMHRGDAATAAALAERALKRLPQNAHFIRGNAWIFYAISNGLLGKSAHAGQQIKDELARAESGEPTYRPRLLHALTGLARLNGSVDEFQVHAEYHLKQSIENDQMLSTTWARMWSGVAHYERNELDEAASHFGVNVQTGEGLNRRAYHDSCVGLALTARALGNPAMARAIAQQLYESHLAMRSGSIAIFLAETRSLMARLDLWSGDIESARLWASDAGEQLVSNPMFYLEVPALTKAKVLVASSIAADEQAADALIDRLLAFARRTHNVRGQIEALALRAVWSAKRGAGAPAHAAMQDAIELAASRHYARTLVDIGPGVVPLLRQLAARGSQVAYVSSLLAMLDREEETRPAARDHDRQDGASARRANALARLPEPLTARELEILSLLAQRLSYREIAGQLHITQGTVGQHVNHIYRKLEASGRGEAVKRAHDLGVL